MRLCQTFHELNAVVGEYTPNQCRVCWKYLNDSKHKEGQDALTDPDDGPGLLRKVFNFGKAIARHTANGLKVVDKETYQLRLELCYACPLLKDSHYCQHVKCGCRVEKKAGWETEKCPVGKW